MQTIKHMLALFGTLPFTAAFVISMLPAAACGADFPANPPDKPGYTLEFSDEFNGTSIDTTKWVPHYLPHWSSRAESAPQYTIGGGALELQNTAFQDPWCPNCDGQLRVSGIMSGELSGALGSTDGLHNFRGSNTVTEVQPNVQKYVPQYGYFEMRAKGALSGGNHLAWWMVGWEDTQDKSGEIDVFEIWGNSVTSSSAVFGQGVHPWEDPNIKDSWRNATYNINVGEYHVYGLEWTPSEVRFYIDNRLVKVGAQSPSYPMVHILSIYENRDAGFNASYPYPKRFTIDYFRGYRPTDGYVANGYYKIVNNLTSHYLHIENRTGRVESSLSVPDDAWSAQWAIENTDSDYFRLRNRWTGEYMHIESNQGYVQSGALGSPLWWSAQWKAVSNGDFVNLQNRWQPTQYIHTESNLGYAESGGQPGWWSAQWSLVPAYDLGQTPNGSGVVFYQDSDYGGATSPLKAKGDYPTLPSDVPNDWMSSLRVPAGWIVDAYEHGSFGGAVCTFTADTSWVGSDCNDKMSSFVIR